MPRVLFVEHKRVFGGGQVALLSLLDELDNRFLEAVVVCQPGAALIGELKERSISPYVFDLGGVRKGRRPRVILGNLVARVVPTLKLARLILRERVDVVYANGAFSLIACVLAAKLTRTPVIWSEHNTTLPLGPEIQLLIGLADKIAVVTEVIAHQFVELSPTVGEKMVTVHNGIDPERFEVCARDRERLRQELGLRKEHCIVGTVGRLAPEKGHHYFLRAAACIGEAIPAARFLVVGEGPLRDGLGAMATDMGIATKVRFTGFREDVPALLSLMDVFVLPSVEEAFSIAVLEAMAAGKPVIASNVGGIYEAVIEGETGYLVQAGDWQHTAERAIELLRDGTKRQRIGEKGRQLVRQHYTLETTCTKTLQLIEKLIGG